MKYVRANYKEEFVKLKKWRAFAKSIAFPGKSMVFRMAVNISV